MRRSIVILLASCAGADLHEQVESKTPPPAAMDEPDPWAVAPGPSLEGGWIQASAPPPPPPELPATIALPVTNEQLTPPPPRPLIAGMHSGSIIVLAATEDGKLAVTADQHGSVRMWPSLDGKREPIVVAMRPPKALAVTRVGDELVIAGLDEIGQAELVRVRASGEVVRRMVIEGSRPWLAIRATSRGFVGLRDDRAVVLLDDGGTLRGPLVADPGQHVSALAVRRDGVLAIIESSGKIRGRWIDLDGASWGELTPVLPIDGGPVALSADHTRVAGIARGGKSLAIVKLATGSVVARPFDEQFVDPTLQPVGFTETGALAFALSDELRWWRGGRVEPVALSNTTATITDHELVAGFAGALAISSPSGIEYVGYRMAGPLGLRPSGTGFVANDGFSVVELDAQLTARKVHDMPALGDGRYHFSPLHLVDDRHIVASGYNGGTNGLYLIDLESAQATLVVQPASLHTFDPSTGLVVYYGTDGYRLMRWNPKTRTFSEPVAVPGAPRVGKVSDFRVVLLDPAVARGNAVALVTLGNDMKGSLTLFRMRAGDRPDLEQTKQKTVQLTDAWFDKHHDIQALIPAAMLAQRRRSPDRKLTAELDDSRITLRDAKGSERWTIPSAGASGLAWTPRGELLAFGSGLARLDLGTGALVERRCGWRFGRLPHPPERHGSGALCDAP